MPANRCHVGHGAVATAITLAVLIIGAMLSPQAYAESAAAPLGKLPTGIAPTHYTLELEVVPNRERFSGRASIDLTLEAATDLIWLHGRDIEAKRAVILAADGSEVAARYEQVNDIGVARIVTDQPVGPGNVKLVIVYDAPFNRSLGGLYRVDVDGLSYAYTQFEPIDARRMFPGFDEPRFKTPYDIILTVEKPHAAISNALERETVDLGNGLKQVRFETTKPLPTYTSGVNF